MTNKPTCVFFLLANVISWCCNNNLICINTHFSVDSKALCAKTLTVVRRGEIQLKMTSSPSNTCRCRVVSRPQTSGAEVNVSTVNVSDNTTSTKVCLNVYAVPGPNVLPQNAKKHCTYRPFYLQYSLYAAMPKGVNLYFTNSERKPYWFATTIRGESLLWR